MAKPAIKGKSKAPAKEKTASKKKSRTVTTVDTSHTSERSVRAAVNPTALTDAVESQSAAERKEVFLAACLEW